MIHNKLFFILPTVAILATVLTLATFTIPTFAQSAEVGRANQTMQDTGQSANQTGENMQQGANHTGEAIQGNASNIGSQITEGAKDMVGKLGEGLESLGK